jgi:hypothetical protein
LRPFVKADEVERVLADVDTDRCNGFKADGLAWHGMLDALNPQIAVCQIGLGNALFWALGDAMRRRDFVTLGGAAASTAWPLSVRAQQR